MRWSIGDERYWRDGENMEERRVEGSGGKSGGSLMENSLAMWLSKRRAMEKMPDRWRKDIWKEEEGERREERGNL